VSVQESTLPTTRTWAVDPMHSTVGFSVTHHAVGTFRGRFTEFEAEFDAAAGKLKGSATTASVDTFEMLNEHLLGEDFLDAANHPKIVFESSSIEMRSGELVVKGDLTFRGVTKPVTTKGSVIGPSKVEGWEGSPDTEHIGIDLETTIDRRDFGMEYNNELLSGQQNLGWDVTLEFSLELVTEAE
jgi:polyisoprenoid-binding protein YceI